MLSTWRGADMQIDGFTFVAQIVNFLILLVLLRRFLYRPIIAAMDRREEEMAGRLEEARLKMVEAREKESEYQQKLRDLDREKENMLQQAKEEVEQKKQQMTAEVRNEVEAMQRRWTEALEGEQQAFFQELQAEAGDRIIELVREILADLSTRDLEKQVVELFIGELASIGREESKKLVISALDYGEGLVLVKSSFEVAETQKQQIVEILQEKVAAHVETRFEVSPQLGFGIEIRAGGWRAGWNLNSYIARLRDGMEEAFRQNTQEKIQ
ncbi:hypothetical protein ACG2F4_18580 [Halalkalibaculum sp. DA3122]|uniref:F0F1 ATP synthase subunit B family protein n=1 Tax=unclassified Halalkalibaculum TaxID=2964617 RepID=UPI0037546849